MHVGTVQPGRVVPGLLEVRGFQRDQRPELGGMLYGEVEHNAAADRAAHDDRALQFHCPAESPDGRRIGRRRQPVLVALPAVGWRRLAVPGHVEREHAIAPGDLGIGEQVAELPAVGASGVQADQGNAAACRGAGFLEIEAMGNALDFEPDVAADHRIKSRCHRQLSSGNRRGSASRSLKYCRFCNNGRRSPWIDAAPRLVSAKRSCQPGAGTACQ